MISDDHLFIGLEHNAEFCFLGIPSRNDYKKNDYW